MSSKVFAMDLRTSLQENLFVKLDRLLDHMMQDKKNSGDDLTLILARGIGKAFMDKQVDKSAVRRFLRQLAKTYA